MDNDRTWRERMDAAGICMGIGFLLCLLSVMIHFLVLKWIGAGLTIGVAFSMAASAVYVPLIAWPIRVKRQGAWRWMLVTVVVGLLAATHHLWIERLSVLKTATGPHPFAMAVTTMAVFAIAITLTTQELLPILVGVGFAGLMVLCIANGGDSTIIPIGFSHLAIGGLIGCVSYPAYLERTKQNECPSCGYDLSGSLGEVCPECGSPREDEV